MALRSELIRSVQRIVHLPVLTGCQVRNQVETASGERPAVVVRDGLAIEVQRAGLVRLEGSVRVDRVGRKAVPRMPDVGVARVQEIHLTAPSHPLGDAVDQEILLSVSGQDGHRDLDIQMLNRLGNRRIVVMPGRLPVTTPGHGLRVILVVVGPVDRGPTDLDGDARTSVHDQTKLLLPRKVSAVRRMVAATSGTAGVVRHASSVLAVGSGAASVVAGVRATTATSGAAARASGLRTVVAAIAVFVHAVALNFAHSGVDTRIGVIAVVGVLDVPRRGRRGLQARRGIAVCITIRIATVGAGGRIADALAVATAVLVAPLVTGHSAGADAGRLAVWDASLRSLTARTGGATRTCRAARTRTRAVVALRVELLGVESATRHDHTQRYQKHPDALHGIHRNLLAP